MRATTAVKPECPPAPPARQTTFSRTLHRACQILGSVDKLAAHLQVAESSLRLWLEGLELPPERIFLTALEMILLDIEAGRRPTA
ncbi:MAG TPA: hypothetical protein VM183_01165 [Burkholderiales bacterium]|nr:hypothetical protein [Burkholderiales bacterium]